MRRICRFTFEDGVERETVEWELATAIRVAECLHGHAKVRFSTGYLFATDGRELVLDTSDGVGEWIARLLTGLLAQRVGERGFSVKKED